MTARCRCGHVQAAHNVNRRMCYGSPVCACSAYESAPEATPARFDERYDPSPDPVDRRPR